MFYEELSHQEDSVEGVCNTFIQNRNGFLSCYLPFLLNVERGQRILTEYGGTFFTDKQREVEDELGLLGHYRRPRERLVEYYEALRDLCYCAQKQYLHGVSLVKVSQPCQGALAVSAVVLAASNCVSSVRL